MLVSLLVGTAAASDCDTSWAELEPQLDGVEAAWGISEDAFQAGMTRVEAGVPCLTEVLTPARAARIHRAEGLQAFLERDLDRARAAFAAARAADPAYAFPVAMVPAANPVRTLYDSAATTGATVPLPPPAKGKVALDGVVTRARPTDRATLFQLGADAPTHTAWLAPKDPTPAYRQRGQGFRLPLLVAGGLAAAGSAALYAVADGLTHDVPTGEWTGEDDVTALRGRNHGLLLGSAGLGVAAVGSVTTALVWGRW